MAGIWSVAIESRKQAASRPRPPLPRPASGSVSASSIAIELLALHGLHHDRLDPEIEDVIRQRPANQELHREVVDLLGVGLIVGRVCLQPALRVNKSRKAQATASNR